MTRNLTSQIARNNSPSKYLAVILRNLQGPMYSLRGLLDFLVLVSSSCPLANSSAAEGTCAALVCPPLVTTTKSSSCILPCSLQDSHREAQTAVNSCYQMCLDSWSLRPKPNSRVSCSANSGLTSISPPVQGLIQASPSLRVQALVGCEGRGRCPCLGQSISRTSLDHFF